MDYLNTFSNTDALLFNIIFILLVFVKLGIFYEHHFASIALL